MSIAVIIPPEPLATWDEARTALRIEDDEQEDYVTLLLAVASATIDGPNGWVGSSLGIQTLELSLDRFDEPEISLPFGPVTSMVAVRYLDADGVERTVEDTAYDVFDTRKLRVRGGTAWPVGSYRPGSVRVLYEAGYDPVPLPVKQAALLLAGHWYANREPVNVGNITSTLPYGVEALLSPYRRWL